MSQLRDHIMKLLALGGKVHTLWTTIGGEKEGKKKTFGGDRNKPEKWPVGDVSQDNRINTLRTSCFTFFLDGRMSMHATEEKEGDLLSLSAQ